MMSAGNLETRREEAMRRCDEQIGWYQRFSSREWRFFVVFQTSAVLLGAATPVLILWSSLPKAVQALPAALASVAAGLVGTFGWLQNKARYSFTAEALKSERVLFTTRTPPSYGLDLDENAALATFVSRIEQIGMTEVSRWQADVVQASPLNSRTASTK
jgi:hypothetical protein